MSKFNVLYSIIFFSMILEGNTIEVSEKNLKNESRKNDSVKFALEVGAKNDFWDAGLQGNVLDYDTEGLFLGFGKLKMKIYDSDVFTIEKYGTLTSSDNQNELLRRYKSDHDKESYIDATRISIQLMQIFNFYFEKDWLNGLNYEYNDRYFIGTARVLQNSMYWYGKTADGRIDEDFVILETGNDLSFKTKFTSHKLSYKFNNILKDVKGSYISIGAFDEEWSKPTFVGDTGLNGELPIVFDANYYSKGVSAIVGLLNNSYGVQAFVNYGIDNEMKIIQKGGDYSKYNRDVDIYTIGLKADYRFKDIYSNNYLSIDVIVGAEMQYNKITQDGGIDIDAETLYGINTGIEITF